MCVDFKCLCARRCILLVQYALLKSLAILFLNKIVEHCVCMTIGFKVGSLSKVEVIDGCICLQ